MNEVTNLLVVELFIKNPLFWIILLLGIVSGIFYKVIVGKAGEHYVKKELKKLDGRYLIINDLLLRTRDDKTHQIDHVVISEYGIFVIETKHYNGFISGNDFSKHWTAGGKLKILNPVHQNYGHIMSISEITNINKSHLISIVCVTGDAKLNVHSKHTLKTEQLLSKIKQYKTSVIRNPETIYDTLITANITDRKTRKNHVKRH